LEKSSQLSKNDGQLHGLDLTLICLVDSGGIVLGVSWLIKLINVRDITSKYGEKPVKSPVKLFILVLFF
jgi:hypothetical protein